MRTWLLVLLLMLPMAQAGLAAESNTIFANYNADDGYYAALEGIESGATGQLLIAPEWGYQSRAMVLEGGLTDVVELDQAAGIKAVAWYDWEAALLGLVPVVLGGQLDVTMELRQGGNVLAQGSKQDVLLAPPNEVKVELTMALNVATIDPAAGDLEWWIEEGGVATGALFIPKSGSGDWSRLELPILAGAAPVPQTRYVDLTEAEVAHQFTNATSDTYQLNFTTDLVNSTANFAWNGTGNVTATLVDANGTVVFDQTLSGNGTLAHAISDAAAGAWNLTLAYDGFNGTFAFSLDPVEDDPSTGTLTGTSTQTSTGTASTTGAPTGNGTGDLNAGKDSPGPALGLLLVGLVAVAARRRW